MNKEEILIELDAINALRINRTRVANLILQHESSFLPLLQIVFDVDQKISIKAAWIFEFVCKEKLEWLLRHFDYFCENIHTVYLGGAVRPIAKVCEILSIQLNKNPFIFNHFFPKMKPIIETQFDWMISQHKIAIKAYTMQSLYLSGKHIDWIHDELKTILIQNIPKESVGYKVRGEKILKLIDEFGH